MIYLSPVPALLTASRLSDQVHFDRRDPLAPVLPVERLDLCRLEERHGTAAAALLAIPAPPPVLADAAAAALLASVALPPVLANASAAALLAMVALPPVLAEAAAAAALLAPAAPCSQRPLPPQSLQL